jgi:predicted RecA/RadA family phage recombinase
MAQIEKAVFVQGDPLMVDYTPNADVAAGDVVDLGNCVGVAHHPILAGRTGAISVDGGVYDFLKFAGEAIALWAPVYWDVGTLTATGTVAYSEAIIGKCIKAALAGDATVRVEQIASPT